MANKLLDGLNPPQRDAVLTESGPMLVLAGAGTGKTRVVTFRIAYLISRGIRPERILAVTFTNKAAAEMRERVKALLPGKREYTPEISTFHSLCVRILRRHIRNLGYPTKFAIYSRGQQETVARQMLRECGVPVGALKPSELLFRISNWKNNGLSPEAALAHAENDKDHLATMAYRRYQRELANRGAVDFDDLLILTEKLFSGFPKIQDEEARRFDHVMVDEYQDTNGRQYEIVCGLARAHQNLCVVGDDDQSIYGWRGAEVKHILRFGKDWPGARIVRLEDNYRSTDAIIQHSNRLIRCNRTRHDKTLKAARPNGKNPSLAQYDDPDEEASEIVGKIYRAIGMKEYEPRDFAILFRTNAQTRVFESELRQKDIPYVIIGGMSFYDRREVRDVLAYLQLLADPEEETSLLRVLNTPPRGIGARTIETLMKQAVANKQTVWDAMLQGKSTLPREAQAAIARFTKLIQTFRNQLAQSLPDTVLKELLQHIDYRKELNRIYPDSKEQEQRWASVGELFNALGAYLTRKGKKADINDFLAELMVDGHEDSSDKARQLQRNAVILMTLHAAKGLEFPNVFMVGMEEGLLPHQRSIDSQRETDIEEERRLCYVGMTRAEDTLSLSLALSRRKWGKDYASEPSRFLYEIFNLEKKHRANAGHPDRAKKTKSSQRRKKAKSSKNTRRKT